MSRVSRVDVDVEHIGKNSETQLKVVEHFRHVGVIIVIIKLYVEG